MTGTSTNDILGGFGVAIKAPLQTYPPRVHEPVRLTLDTRNEQEVEQRRLDDQVKDDDEVKE